MATSRSASRASSSARKALIEMLKDDHKRAKKAFREFEKLDLRDDAERGRALVEATCAELSVHATLEEELFYPAARGVMKAEDLLDEAEVEHMTARQLIAQLQGMELEADPARYRATFKVLGEYIKHHVKEEEGELFPQLERARLDWEGLRDEMRVRREELEAELLGTPVAAQPSEQDEDNTAAVAQPLAPQRGRAARAGAAERAQAASGKDRTDRE